MQARSASQMALPLEGVATVDAASTVSHRAMSEPGSPRAATLALPPANQGPKSVPAPMPAGAMTLRPVGGHWPLWCIALAVELVRAVKLSLRSTPKVLAALFRVLTGCATASRAVMSWTTVRCWLMRLGLYALRRPLERGNDWAYLVDHTVQIGSMKCFAVVGIRLCRLPYPERCLQRQDMHLIALVPMAHSNAVTVKQAIEDATLRTGVPRLIVSDEGTDVRGGIERYCDHHAHTAATCDIAHKGANLLRRLLEADERWAGFVAQLGQTKAKLQQTRLACWVGPSLRPKARFMNLAAPLRWARWCLRALDRPWPTAEALSDRQRAVLATIPRESLEEKLGWLRAYRQAIEQWSQWHEVIQVAIRQVRRHGIADDSVATLRQQFDAQKLPQSGRDAAEAMIAFVAEQAWAVWPDGKRLIGSTEILESLFGELKTVERQQSESGFTGLILALGAIASPWTDEEIKGALEAIPWKAAQAWINERLGPTVQAQRCTARTILGKA
jgi:hypothetical protein